MKKVDCPFGGRVAAVPGNTRRISFKCAVRMRTHHVPHSRSLVFELGGRCAEIIGGASHWCLRYNTYCTSAFPATPGPLGVGCESLQRLYQCQATRRLPNKKKEMPKAR